MPYKRRYRLYELDYMLTLVEAICSLHVLKPICSLYVLSYTFVFAALEAIGPTLLTELYAAVVEAR